MFYYVHLDYYLNEAAADYSLWQPNNLSRYDLVIFATHGSAKSVSCDGTKKNEVSLCTRGNPRISLKEFKGRTYMESTNLLYWQGYIYDSISNIDYNHEQYKSIDYNNSIIYAMACHSYENDYEDLMWYFMNHHCSAYLGMNGSVSVFSMDNGIEVFVDYLTKGVSVLTTALLIQNLDFLLEDFRIPISARMTNDGKVYLINPTPTNLRGTYNDNTGNVTLSWEMPKIRGTYRYDVYLEDTLLQENLELTNYSFSASTPGNYQWHVISKLYDGEKVFDVHQSETATFTIENHLASVTVSPVEIIKAFSARIGVTIETELGVLEKGVVYSSTVKTPVIGDPACIKAVSESEDLFFGLDINYLQPETKYTVCGYVILDNSPDEGIVVYSAPVSFVTKPDDTPQFPDWDDMDWSVD